MSSYFYFQGADGRRFCYAKEPTFLCPLGQLRDPDLAVGESYETPEAFERAAAILGVHSDGLVRMVLRGHRNNRRERDANGKLTDRCNTCGHRMERLGFRVWEEVESARTDAGAQITRAMGNTPTEIVRTRYMETKREAIEWGREEARISRGVAA